MWNHSFPSGLSPVSNSRLRKILSSPGEVQVSPDAFQGAWNAEVLRGSRRNAYKEAAQASHDFSGYTFPYLHRERSSTADTGYFKGQFKALQSLGLVRYSTNCSLKSSCLTRCLSNEYILLIKRTKTGEENSSGGNGNRATTPKFKIKQF